ncbi:kynureninase [Vibrio aquimaris]|uniref:Kynureninase n=1 Tax=Vibrio aquimaris TaxID=2587862 RepID=A0A5P9CQS0_9VIBR|nr:kynureninase [Vibrio aquimaris]QFT28554.1 Kynureninase [Vibrio aquimaris]
MDMTKDLQTHYQGFDVSERILLSGHSHQAWPDVAKQGMVDCFNDAAKHIDDKWELAFEKAEKVRNFYRRAMCDPSGQMALGESTHELILMFLSDLNCFKAKKSTQIKIVTTDGEFHSMRRQLNRLKTLGINVEVVPTLPLETLSNRIIEKLDRSTDAVMLSAVFFATSQIFKQVGEVAQAAKSLNIPCVVDAYHTINVLEFDLAKWQLQGAFVIGGGYKYCQAGEGNCFMRIPPNYHGSPIITGWFAEFETLSQAPDQVSYGQGQAAFAGSTYDPTSHYRAAAVFDFFDRLNLSVALLSQINRQQVSRLWRGIENLHLAHEVLALPCHDIADNAGFLSLTTPQAEEWVQKLKSRGVQADSRGNQLRLGPAPYVSNEQIDNALNEIELVAKQFS